MEPELKVEEDPEPEGLEKLLKSEKVDEKVDWWLDCWDEVPGDDAKELLNDWGEPNELIESDPNEKSVNPVLT